jgi:hypothetical protein
LDFLDTIRLRTQLSSPSPRCGSLLAPGRTPGRRAVGGAVLGASPRRLMRGPVRGPFLCGLCASGRCTSRLPRSGVLGAQIGRQHRQCRHDDDKRYGEVAQPTSFLT